MKLTVAWCTTLALSEYTTRYSKVAGYIHWTMCKLMGLHITDKYYEHKLERVINVNSATVILDVLVITDWTTLANQPDIVLLADRYSRTRRFKHYHKRSWKTKQVQNLVIWVSRMWKVTTYCASYNWSIRNN
jgi:ribonuclease HIII